MSGCATCSDGKTCDACEGDITLGNDDTCCNTAVGLFVDKNGDCVCKFGAWAAASK